MTSFGFYIGAALIVIGLVINFAGVKLLVQTFMMLTFLSTFCLLFLLGYTLLPQSMLGKKSLGGVALASVVIGGVAAYFSRGTAKKWAFPVFAAWTCTIGIETLV